MKCKKKISIILIIAFVLSFQTACNKSYNPDTNIKSDSATTVSDASSLNNKTEGDVFLKPYDDIRAVFENEKVFKEYEYSSDDIQAAQDEGILVLDCSNNEKTGFIAPAFYNTEDPDNVSMCTGGFPTSTFIIPSSQIGVPTSYRTVAEEYSEGSPSYQYTGQGGLSWGIPYAAGVLALGWQINPTLDNDQIVQILFETCTIASDGSNMINPIAFIDAINKTMK